MPRERLRSSLFPFRVATLSVTTLSVPARMIANPSSSFRLAVLETTVSVLLLSVRRVNPRPPLSTARFRLTTILSPSTVIPGPRLSRATESSTMVPSPCRNRPSSVVPEKTLSRTTASVSEKPETPRVPSSAVTVSTVRRVVPTAPIPRFHPRRTIFWTVRSATEPVSIPAVGEESVAVTAYPSPSIVTPSAVTTKQSVSPETVMSPVRRYTPGASMSRQSSTETTASTPAAGRTTNGTAVETTTMATTRETMSRLRIASPTPRILI